MELGMVQGMVKTALLNQRIVITLFNNRSILYNKDRIRILNGRKSVGNDKGSTSLKQLI